MNPPVNHPSLLPRLATSSLFTGFRDAFHIATGRTLTLQPVDHTPAEDSTAAAAWSFAKVLQVPVLLNGQPLALLELDAVRLTDGPCASFDDLARQMLDEGSDAAELRTAQQTFQAMPALSRDRLDALATMLTCFSAQLGELAYRLFLQCDENEPPAVRRARLHISQHLAEPMCLEEVARHSGVSPFHFCKIFKRFTGLTFTEYVNRARVEHAKKLLLKPFSRVTEVAYDVGFQSLSQFNRSFRRVMAQSPTEFKSQMTPARKRKLLAAS